MAIAPLVVRLSAQNNWNTIVKNIPDELIISFLPQILYWQLYYLSSCCGEERSAVAMAARHLQCGIKMLPTIGSRSPAAINEGRKVSLRYSGDGDKFESESAIW